MKRFLTLVLMAAMMLLMTIMMFGALSSCGSAGEVIDYDLVFVNDSDFTVVTVVAQFEDRVSGVQNADSSPLKKGETFGFEAGAYPVTVAVYDKVVRDYEQGELGRVTIPKAPPEGERWYVTAHDDGSGLAFTVDISWPEGV